MSLNSQILNKILRYCAYRERSEKEVKTKLFSLGCSNSDLQDYLNYLVENNYLNQQRFIESFVRSKTNSSKWGKTKVKHALRFKGISDENTINEVFESVDPELYLDNLKKILQKKWLELERKNDPKIKEKTIRFALSRGYAYDEIMQVLPSFGISSKS
ncbi:MAG: regulatory protein RecX [Bacteroidales bacterium]|nr:regulatory protein RecX [Bacteroidales bacterium]